MNTTTKTRKLTYRRNRNLKHEKDWAHLRAMTKRIEDELFTLKQFNYDYPRITAAFEQLLQTIKLYAAEDDPNKTI